jgi:hypothetical protein
MSEPVTIALISALPGIAAAILALVGVIIGNHNKTKIQDLTIRVDGRLDELLSAAAGQGRLAEQSDQRERDAEKKQ